MALTEVIVKFSGDIFSVAQDLFGQAELLSDDYAIITIDEGRISELYQYVEIEDIELSKELFLPSFNLNSSCIAYPKSTNGYDLHGEGVITAIIDSGIDYAHPDFRNSDGTTRILCIWDQTISGIPPDGFKKGREITVYIDPEYPDIPEVPMNGLSTFIALMGLVAFGVGMDTKE